ncbi:MAG: ABC transporter permease, partial [Bacillota bacterium]
MGSVIKLRLLRLKDDFWVYLLMMIMAFGLTVVFGVSFDEYRPTVLIIDENNSSYSKELSEELNQNEVFRFQESDRESAITMVEEGKVLAAILIGDHFESDIKEGDSISLGVMKLKQDILLLTLNEQLSAAVQKMAGGARISEITADYILSKSPEADRQEVKESAYGSVMD